MPWRLRCDTGNVRTLQPEDQVAYLNSVALNLHGFYNGIERLLELVVVDMDGAALGGDAWHAELLRQVELEIPRSDPR